MALRLDVDRGRRRGDERQRRLGREVPRTPASTSDACADRRRLPTLTCVGHVNVGTPRDQSGPSDVDARFPVSLPTQPGLTFVPSLGRPGCPAPQRRRSSPAGPAVDVAASLEHERRPRRGSAPAVDVDRARPRGDVNPPQRPPPSRRPAGDQRRTRRDPPHEFDVTPDNRGQRRTRRLRPPPPTSNSPPPPPPARPQDGFGSAIRRRTAASPVLVSADALSGRRAARFGWRRRGA